MVQALGRWPVNVDGPGSRPVRVSFVVDKVALERRIFFFRVLNFFPVIIIPQILRTHLCLHLTFTGPCIVILFL